MSCKYCKRYENIRGYDGEAFIDDYEFYIDIDDFDNESVLEVHSLTSNEIARIRIQYCPMCGDKLVKEGINIQHMVLSDEDYNKLVEKYGEDVVEKNIEGLKNYNKAKKYKSAYLTLNKWCKRDVKSKDNGWGDVE